MPAPSVASLLVRDASDTAARIRRDVARLRDIGKAAIGGIRVAALRARQRAEDVLEDVAVEVERHRRGGRF